MKKPEEEKPEILPRSSLLEFLATLEPLEEDFGPFEDAPAEPFDL